MEYSFQIHQENKNNKINKISYKVNQRSLKRWTEHSQESPGLDGGWFFGPWAFIAPKSSFQDPFNEWSKDFFWVHWNLFSKLLKHGHFGINFRFWLVWVELRKSKALSSLNFLQRHEKYQIGSYPQLFYA